MKLIVGLGNPGRRYEKTRHNIGFMAVDLFVKKHNFKYKYEPRFEGALATGLIDQEKIYILKPATYMNLSGNSVNKAIKYFNIDLDDVIIVYDDVDLELGQIRLRASGSSGGQKGMKDIINHLSTDHVKRIRVGISKTDDIVDHVLSKFSKKERTEIEISLEKIADALTLFSQGIAFENIMTQYNG